MQSNIRTLIVMEGTDASGKSSIHRRLMQHYKSALFVREPYYSHNVQKLKHCNDPLSRIKIFIEDREQLYREVILPNNKNLIISDRSYISNLVYNSLELESTLNLSTQQAINYIEDNQPNILYPDHILYTFSSPMVINNRCHNRNEEMSIEYAQQLQDRYKLIFDMFNINYTTINTNDNNIEQCTKMCINLINQLL
jgi:dTMP kinase